MNKQEFDKLYVGEKKVVHCPTEELANEFLKEAHRHGYKWQNGTSYLEDNNWEFEKEETCYTTLTKEHIKTTREKLRFLEDRDTFTLEG